VPILERWKISPRYQPAREVGGDFYDFHLLSEGIVGLVVGHATARGSSSPGDVHHLRHVAVLVCVLTL
jgi:serine phosphatase RsbU (regulator of sigma subunit)